MNETTDSVYSRRWGALAALAIVQFMLILDSTVVNVALPSIQRSLHFSISGLAWVVDGYALMAGGLLLFGGRLGDLTGRRRLFLIGLGLFAAASAVSGAAPNSGFLIASRLAQGAGEALAAPSALAIVALLFNDPAERARALGIWGGLAGVGGTLGVVLSGVITSELDWRWIFFINLPVALIAFLAVPRLVPADRGVADDRGTIDVAGAVLVTGGLVAVVLGLLNAARHPWGDPSVLVPLVAGAVLLAALAIVESRVAQPLVPFRVLADRTRLAANVTSIFQTSAFFAMFFSLTLYMQQVLGYSPLRTGLAYVPFGGALIAGVGASTNLVPRAGIRAVAVAGGVIGAVGLLLLSMIPVHGHYASAVLPGMLVLAFGSGLLFPAVTNGSLAGVSDADAGLASGLQSTVQQVGGSLGLAVIVTAGSRHAADLLAHGQALAAASTHGYALGFRIASIVLLAGALASALLMRSGGAGLALEIAPRPAIGFD